jgi:hypothetical protein
LGAANRDKGLKMFFTQGLHKQIPAQLKKRQVILEYLVEAFEPERLYSEETSKPCRVAQMTKPHSSGCWSIKA